MSDTPEQKDLYEKERNDPFITWHNGKPVGRLNERLAKSQKVTPEQLANLVRLHGEKDNVLQLMEETDDVAQLKLLAAEVTKFEYQLQENWNFTQDKSFHEWYLVPKCTCPKMDNAERRGTPYQIITVSCPIHGN